MIVVESSQQPVEQARPLLSQSLESLLDAIQPARGSGALELAVVIPTYNERGNVATIIQRLSQVLSNICHEILVVDDDSPDGPNAMRYSAGLHRLFH